MLSDQSKMKESAKFTYYSLEKQTKKKVDALKLLTFFNKIEVKPIENIFQPN